MRIPIQSRTQANMLVYVAQFYFLLYLSCVEFFHERIITGLRSSILPGFQFMYDYNSFYHFTYRMPFKLRHTHTKRLNKKISNEAVESNPTRYLRLAGHNFARNTEISNLAIPFFRQHFLATSTFWNCIFWMWLSLKCYIF